VIRKLTLLACALGLTGCITVKVAPSDVVFSNADAQRAGAVFKGGAPASQANLPGFTVTPTRIQTPAGALHAVLAESDAKRPLVVFCGGNGFREEYAGADRARALAPFGDMLMFDYPGYGASEGVGTSAEFTAAQPAIVARAEQELARRGGDLIIWWGHSLGGGYCAGLAAQSHVRSILVMEGAFGSIPDIAAGKAGPLKPLVRLRIDPQAYQYDSPALLSGYGGPIVIVASRKDETIPFATSRRLAARLAQAGKAVTFVTLQQGRHSTLYRDPQYGPLVRAAVAKAEAAVR
jgi:pimeloyl-ACP methyl ester carboxylesterase